MLVLSRDCDTVIRIGSDIKVKVLSIRKQRVKLGVDAPHDIRVWREEVLPESALDTPPVEGTATEVSAEVAPFSILVVEDDADHAQLIQRALKGCESSQVMVANSGKAAIKALGDDRAFTVEGTPPNLVLLDLHLPDISGLEVLRQIRSIPRYRALPVVMLSSENRDTHIADCLEAGANAFVSKSVHFREFRESVSRIAAFWQSDCRLPKLRSRASV